MRRKVYFLFILILAVVLFGVSESRVNAEVGDDPPGQKEQYNTYVTIKVRVIGSGTVTSDFTGIDCREGEDNIFYKCYFSWLWGYSVTLTATPDAGHQFIKWTNCSSSTNASILVNLFDPEYLCEAWFLVPDPPYTLEVSKTGSGSVTSSSPGIICGSDCSEVYNSITEVTLTANPEPYSVFTGWSGYCSGASTCEITMNHDVSVSATFEPMLQI